MDEPKATPAAPISRRRGFFAQDRPWINGLLFILTLGSAFFVGLGWSAGYLEAGLSPGGSAEMSWHDPRVIALSLGYAVVLLFILLGHELGHYLTCRRYGIDATLPFFIPAPTLIGTMGAFIRIRSPIGGKRRLFDMGAAGPLAGFVLALPAVIVGLALSKTVPALPRDQSILFGEPLLLRIVGFFFFRNAGPGFDIVPHPVAFAGWVGIFVTSLNLLPLGQLDGGHIAYAVFGRRAHLLAKGFFILLLIMGVLFWVGWFLWAVLVFVLGLKHPIVWDENAPLDRGRILVAVGLLVIFILSFIPDPIQGMDLITLLRGL